MKRSAQGHGCGVSPLGEQQDRDVALKVLPAGLLADEAARKRSRGGPSSMAQAEKASGSELAVRTILEHSLLAQEELAQAEKEIADAEVVAATEGRLRGIDTAITGARGHAANGKGQKLQKV